MVRHEVSVFMILISMNSTFIMSEAKVNEEQMIENAVESEAEEIEEQMKKNAKESKAEVTEEQMKENAKDEENSPRSPGHLAGGYSFFSRVSSHSHYQRVEKLHQDE